MTFTPGPDAPAPTNKAKADRARAYLTRHCPDDLTADWLQALGLDTYTGHGRASRHEPYRPITRGAKP